MSVPVKAATATAGLSLALVAASATAYADPKCDANPAPRPSAQQTGTLLPTAQDPRSLPDLQDLPNMPSLPGLSGLQDLPDVPSVEELRAPQIPVRHALQVPPRVPHQMLGDLSRPAGTDLLKPEIPLSLHSPLSRNSPLSRHSPHALHSLRSLHGVRGVHSLRGVHGIRSLHGLRGLHDLHTLRALQAVPGLRSGQRRTLRLALVQEGVRHRRAALVANWRTRASRAVRFAYHQRGRPYVYGGTGRRGFDCSGLVQQSWRHAGVRLARIARSQFHTIRTHIPASRLQPGDLLFFNGLGHVGLYVGRGRFIHSPHTGDHVRVARFASYYRHTFVGATRPAWRALPRVPTSL